MTEEIRKQMKADDEDSGLSIFDYLIILAKRKKVILLLTLPVAIITFTLTLFNNYFYQAQTSIYPSQKQNISMASQFMNQFGILPGRGGNPLNNQNLFVEIIKSRTFFDKLLAKFHLKEIYGVEDDAESRKMLYKNITIIPDFTDKSSFNVLNRNRSPLMKIVVIDNNPKRAANIANAIVEELNTFVSNIAISEASQRRLFFENQLKKAHENLIIAENAVKQFQEKTGILEVKTQTDMVIEKVANIQAQIMANEIQLQVMKSYFTENNPDFQKVNETITALKKELAKQETSENTSKSMLIPTGTIPSLGLEYKRIFRKLKFNETLYEIIVKQYEAAKLDEAKDATMIQVIDKAVPPEKKGKVRRLGRSKALATTTFTLFFSCLLAFALEFHEKASTQKEYSKRIKTLRRYLSFTKNK